MSWIYRNSNDNEYRYALGEIQDNAKKLLFCFGINPSTATPEKLDPTAKRIQRLAQEHGYDSWVVLNVCAQRATNPNDMNKRQKTKVTDPHKENLKIIASLLKQYGHCSDILFAYGDLIEKRSYLKSNLNEILNTIREIGYTGGCYCLGVTKAGNARHPLYQKVTAPFLPYSLEKHT